MTTWETSDGEPWAGDQWQYRRLTELTVRVIASGVPMQITYVFMEDEVDHLVILDDPSVLAAINRLGAGGWQAVPLEAEAGEAPPFLIGKLRETRKDLRSDGAMWRRYWLSRRVAIDYVES